MTDVAFGSECIMVQCRQGGDESANGAWMVRQPTLKQTCGILFICGTLYYPRTRGHWMHGRHVSIALDDVSSIIEFENADDYRSVADDCRSDDGGSND